MIKNLLKSEGLKFLYHKWIRWGLFFLAVFLPSMVMVLNASAEKRDFDFIVNQLMQSFYLGQAGFSVIAVLYFGEEMTDFALRPGILCTPRRHFFFLGKLGSMIIWESIFFLLFSVFCFLAAKIGFEVSFSFENVVNLIKWLLPSYLSTMELSLIGAGLTVISGSMIFSLSILLPMILGLGQLLLQFGDRFCFFPVLSVMNSFTTMMQPLYPKVGTGLFIQFVWCVGICVIAFFGLKKKMVK